MHGQVQQLHPNTQLMHNIQLRVLRPPKRRVIAAPNPVILALVDMHRAGPFIARNAIAGEVAKPKVAHLHIRHFGDAQHAIVASAVASLA